MLECDELVEVRSLFRVAEWFEQVALGDLRAPTARPLRLMRAAIRRVRADDVELLASGSSTRRRFRSTIGLTIVPSTGKDLR